MLMNLEQEVFDVPVAVSHALQPLDLVVDPLRYRCSYLADKVVEHIMKLPEELVSKLLGIFCLEQQNCTRDGRNSMLCSSIPSALLLFLPCSIGSSLLLKNQLLHNLG